jgi:hypothetical protein
MTMFPVDEKPYSVVRIPQGAAKVTPDKAGSSGNKYFHGPSFKQHIVSINNTLHHGKSQ